MDGKLTKTERMQITSLKWKIQNLETRVDLSFKVSVICIAFVFLLGFIMMVKG